MFRSDVTKMAVGKSPRGRWAIPQNLTPAGTICWCFNLPDDPEYQAVFWGLMNDLTKRYNWGEPLTAASDTVAAYWRGIIDDNRTCFEAARDMANKGCGAEFDKVTRYNELGLLEFSVDGGLTWAEDESDPRMVGTLIPPPLWLIVGGDNRCKGAVTARLNTKLALDEIFNNGVNIGVTGLIGIIVGVICAISAGVACAVAGVAGALATIIAQVGAAILQAAMTPAVYDTFECILYCHIGLNASFTEQQWQAVKADIAIQLSGDAEFVLWNWVNMLGPAGLTNLARMSIDVIADCSGCGCSCDNPELGDAGVNLLSRPDLGAGWWQVTTTLVQTPGCETNGCYYATILLPACCLHVEYNLIPPGVNAPPGNRGALDCNGVWGYANYGVGGCQSAIVFRSYGEDVFEFHIQDCPP